MWNDKRGEPVAQNWKLYQVQQLSLDCELPEPIKLAIPLLRPGMRMKWVEDILSHEEM